MEGQNKLTPRAGLYVHIPFCHSKCLYCDFYSLPLGRTGGVGIIDKLTDAIIREYELRKAGFLSAGSWHTVYLGGGTPSLLSHEYVARLLKQIGPLTETEEITIEVNPEDVTTELIKRYKEAGITRVSMGIQSFNDTELRAVGRRHNAATALNAIEVLDNSGLDYSLDLIYGLPHQTLESWKRSLKLMLSFKPKHFSAYSLTFEEGTPLTKLLEKGKITEAPEGLVENMYEILCNEASKAGYNHYEISNFALPGKEAIHNSSYWDMTPYLGLGPAAHSFDGIQRTINPSDLKLYLDKIGQGEPATIVDPEDGHNIANSVIITSLRTSKGLDLTKVIFEDNDDRATFLASIDRHIAEDNLSRLPSGNIRIPESRWLVSDNILIDLIMV